MGIELLFLLLPVAALSGWLAGRNKSHRKAADDCPPYLNSRYFQGLNYLLDEKTDDALDVFIGISELDSESVEIQFALASLFLRRGEVDRAIRIHQNLIARPTLSTEHRRQALYALGMDYMSAGLLDRAETLFRDLQEDGVHGFASRKQLLDIFQQEKEWEKAIDVSQRFRGDEKRLMSPIVAQYHCELVELAKKNGDLVLAMNHVRSAVDWDSHCVRASLLEADILTRQGNFRQAINSCLRVKEQDPDYLPLILIPLQHCFEQLGRLGEYQLILEDLSQHHPSQALNETMVKYWLFHGDRNRAEIFINEALSKQPTLQGLSCLLDVLRDKQNDPVQWQRLRDVTTTLRLSKPSYQCRQCGYHGKGMLWQCPGCKQWNSIKPV